MSDRASTTCAPGPSRAAAADRAAGRAALSRRASIAATIRPRPTALLAGELPGYVYQPRRPSRTPTCWPKNAASCTGRARGDRPAREWAALALALFSQLDAGRPRGGQQPALWPQPGAAGRRGGAAGLHEHAGRHLQPAGGRGRRLRRARGWSWSRRSPTRCCESRTWRRLAEAAHEAGARLLVDNTLAGPTVCRPLEHGADLVLESLTKTMNGHSDVVLGLLCGAGRLWQRVPRVLSTWGLYVEPVRLLAGRAGLETLAVRMERACANALAVANHLVDRPGADRGGALSGLAQPSRPRVGRPAIRRSVRLAGHVHARTAGWPSAEAFIARGQADSVLPVAGRNLHHAQPSGQHQPSRAQRPKRGTRLGIEDGTIRLSVGIESSGLDHRVAGRRAGRPALGLAGGEFGRISRPCTTG